MEEALCISNARLEDIDLIGCLSAQTQKEYMDKRECSRKSHRNFYGLRIPRS